MEDLSVVIIARDEEHQLPELFETIAGVEDVVLVDDGSTDKTAWLARKLGARVYKVGDRFMDSSPTADDVERFRGFFGWEPRFTTEDRFFSSYAARNFAASKAKHDFVYNPDCDERTTWDLGEIRALLPEADVVRYHFQQSVAESFFANKLYRRSLFSFRGRVHEAIVAETEGARIVVAEHMSVVHQQEHKPARQGPGILVALEFAATAEDSVRNLFYLGREYARLGDYSKAMVTLERYLERAVWHPEMAEALFIQGAVSFAMNNPDEARRRLLAAIGLNPNFREALNLLAASAEGADREAWSRYAATATDEGVLFRRSFPRVAAAPLVTQEADSEAINDPSAEES